TYININRPEAVVLLPKRLKKHLAIRFRTFSGGSDRARKATAPLNRVAKLRRLSCMEEPASLCFRGAHLHALGAIGTPFICDFPPTPGVSSDFKWPVRGVPRFSILPARDSWESALVTGTVIPDRLFWMGV